MALVVNTNVMSLTSQRFLSNNSEMLQKSLEKLSSGYRINRAGDDAAGLQVSENLRSQIRGSKMALGNVQDGMNVMNIADGALSVITENLQRMRELVVQAANDTNSVNSRAAIQQELESRAADITRIAGSTSFNGVNLLDGTTNGAGVFVLQVGANNSTTNDVIDLGNAGGFTAVDASNLGVDAANLAVDNNGNALTTLALIDTAISTINTQRATIGSVVNQLSSASQSLQLAIENLSTSESRIRNVDVAAESATMTQNQILQQSAAIVLGQANQVPNLALQLLRGQ